MNVCDSFLQNGIKATENVDTSKISSIRAGGYAKYGIYPDNIGNLIKAVKICLLLDLRYKIQSLNYKLFIRRDYHDLRKKTFAN